MFADLPIDEVEMHPFAQPPTEDEFLAAIARPVREWILETALTLQPATCAFMEHKGVDLIDTYLNNLAANMQLMDGCNASLWIWYSTVWLPENDCCTCCWIVQWNTTRMFGMIRSVLTTKSSKQNFGTAS